MQDDGLSDNPAEAPENAIMLTDRAWVLPADVTVTFARSSGPGGQAVNKLSTRAQLRLALPSIGGLHPLALDRLRRLAGQRLTMNDELLLQSDRHRSQLDNRRDCWQRLAELVHQAEQIPRKRRPTRPSRAMIERRLESKRQRGEKKQRRQWRPNHD